MGTAKDITGQRFGKLTAIRWTGVTVPTVGRVWLCRCDCGNYREVTVNRLVSGSAHQCEECNKADQKNRMTNVLIRSYKQNKLRSVWNQIKYRCFNPSCKAYKQYGGRGIRMCKEWAANYQAFADWAFSHGYKEGLSIDRIDVNGDYCPENCRFIPMREQYFNRRDTLFVSFNGKQIPVSLIVYQFSLDYASFVKFIKEFSTT
jgi:hypothetical protein